MAAGTPYLHPIAKATQVLHILCATSHAAHAIELVGGVVDVLRRYPAAPGGRGRVG